MESHETGGLGIFEVWHSIPVKKIKNKPLTHVSRTSYENFMIERERGFDIIDDTKRTIVKVKYMYKVHSIEESQNLSMTLI